MIFETNFFIPFITLSERKNQMFCRRKKGKKKKKKREGKKV